jgi:hypothetical protein
MFGGHFGSLPIAKGPFWNAHVAGYFGNGATSEVGGSEVTDDFVYFFVGINAMLAFWHTPKDQDHGGYDLENGQFETSCRSEFGRKFVFPERQSILSLFTCLN